LTSWEIIYKATVFIAEEMGVALKKSAFSPNIRERMDHSCAVLNERGEIIAQAEHIPAHLGSLKVGVSNAMNYIKENKVELKEGDMLLFNDPYISGTHINDVTVLAPVYYKGEIVGYVINKAHQVDVGGPSPGSINPYGKTLYEEGLVIPPVKILKENKINKEIIDIIRENFKSPEIGLGDLNAQLAANRMGIRRINQLIEKYGFKEVEKGWKRAIEYGRELTLREIREWRRGEYEAEDYLEWKEELINIRIKLKITDEKVIADFTGTHEQIEGPLNSVLGVTFSAVSYPIRCAIGKEIPTNDGFYSSIELIAPEGILVNPRKPAAVGGGNVETTQRISDVTFLALSKALPEKIPAAGSGTMMNVMMGGSYKGKYWTYYETIGGGTGARPNKDGVSGVHVNMTNTLNTPIEIAERQYPLIFTRYTIREGSGGEGKYRGGDGIIRAFKVTHLTSISVLGERFKIPPWGLSGGRPGKTAKVTIIRNDGRIEEMPGKFSTILYPGDEIIIETPGGGGFGKVENRFIKE
jgi:N-methylhydantoinase B